MDYEVFTTRADAEDRIDKMAGWDTKAEQLYIPDHQKADHRGDVWVIQCDGSLYLRDDGFVR